MADESNRALTAAGLSSRKPRLGFLGVGWIGLNRLQSIARANLADIVAIADPVEDLAQKAAAFAPGAVQMSGLAELVEANLDGVVIATPSAQHVSQTLEALGHGLAVFCQKPLGRNTAETRTAVDAAKAADRLLGVDLSYRFTDAMRNIRALVSSGALGEIFAANLVFHNAYGPQKPWFYDPRQSGGGCVMDLGIHLMDSAMWILPSAITRVESRLFCKGKPLLSRDAACEDYATARIDLSSGASVNLTCSWNLHAGCDAVIEAAFYGTEGGASMRNLNGSFTEFVAERFTGTRRECTCQPPDDWSGRAAVDWVTKLGRSASYDPGIESIIAVTAALDAIYEGMAEP